MPAPRRARIYQPSKSAMQSARGPARPWLLEMEPQAARSRDPLMGWTSSPDTAQQLRLRFETEEAAVAYCKRNKLDYVIRAPHERQVRPKSYAANFR